MAGTSKPAPPSSPSTQVSICLELLDDIQEQLRFADSKAGFISVLNVFLMGFVANHFDKVKALYDRGHGLHGYLIAIALVMSGIYLLTTVASFLLIVSSVMSRFSGRGTQSRVFFGQIATRYDDGEHYAEAIQQMSDADWVRELGNQIAAVSRLALIKHKRIRWATMTTLASVLLWLVALVTLVSIGWAKG